MGDVIKIVRYPTGEYIPIVCLCGSTRFKDEFLLAAGAFTLQGKIVVMPGVFAHTDEIDLNDATKTNLDTLHRRKIDLADEIYVINVGGYVGESTLGEIEYAEATGKRVAYLEEFA